MRRFLRIVRKILFWTFFVSLFIVTTVTVILHVYEDDIKQYAIDELNEYLETDMDVMQIELSVFHDFPYASLEFNRVFIADAYKEQESNDTLFYAEKVFFNFNLFDIWEGDYRVKRISVNNGSLNLRTTATGDVNYDIIKPRDSTSRDSSNFKFMLELLRLDQIDFSYSNLATNQFYTIDVNSGLLTGDFSAESYDLNASGDLYIHQLKSNAFTLIKEKNADLELNMNIDRVQKSYHFERGALTIEEMPFNITGFLDSSHMDFQITGQNIRLDQLANSLADPTLDDTKKYQGQGDVTFSSRISGEISKSSMPSVTADFNISSGSLTEPENQLKIHDVNLIGHYQNQQADREELLSFTQLNLKMLNSYFSGTGSIRDFNQPLITTEIEGDMNLEAFHKFFKIDKIEKLAGNIRLDLDLAIRFLDPEYRKDQFEIIKSNGRIHLTNVLYNKHPDEMTYQDINGDIVINGKDAAAQNLTLKTGKTDLKLNGAMMNLIPYIEGKGNLGLIATLESKLIDLDEFMTPDEEKATSAPVMFELPSNVNLNLELVVGQLNWDNHQFNQITGKLLMSNRKITVNHFILQTLGGKVSGNLVLNNLMDRGNVIDGDLSFSQINVKQLFTEWENFQQETITDKHLSGTAAGKLSFLLVFNPYFSLIEDQLYSAADLNITQGQLDNLETMKAITDYMRSNKGLKVLLNKHIDQFEDKLMHLKFQQLTNSIEIKNRRITIPKMLIKSNALDVELFGWHDFDNNVEYHFSFRFRDLKTKAEYTEFGKVEDDGLGLVIYLTMSGNIDDPSFALDRGERKNDLKETITEEKQNFKSILKTEFGLFKSDSSVQVIEQNNKREVEFIYYKEDQDEISDTSKTKEKNKGRVGKIFDKWKEEQEGNKDKVNYQQDK